MNRKHAWLLAVTCTLAGVGGLRAQGPAPVAEPAVPGALTAAPVLPASPILSTTPAAAAQAAATDAAAARVDGALVAPTGGRLSAYLLGCRPACCGPVGGNGPIGYELFFRWGLAFPLTDGYLANTVQPGWVVQGGGRTYLFDVPGDAAWALEFGISNVSNHGKNPEDSALVFPPAEGLLISVSNLNRTYVNLGLGRQYWFHSALFPGLFGNGHVLGLDRAVGRAGFDVGGRWGTARLEVRSAPNELPLSTPRRNDTIGAFYMALHSDVEIPCGCCQFILGGRLEWDYTWMNLLPDKDTDFQNINLLMNLGIRF